MSVYAQIKIGDQNPGEQSGVKNGMLIDCIDTNEWNTDNFKFGKQSEKAFALIEVDEQYKDLLRAKSQRRGDGIISKLTDRDKKGYFDLDVLGKKFSADMLTKWKGSDSIPVLDGRSLRIFDLLKDTADYNLDKVRADLNAVVGGTYTLGSGGQDYANGAAADADTGAQTSDLRFNLETDIFDTTSVNINNTDNGYEWKMSSASGHGGDPTAALVWNTSLATDWGIIRTGGTGIMIIDGIKVKVGLDHAGKNVIGINAHNTGNLLLSNLFFDGNGKSGTAIYGLRFLTYKISNCVIYDNAGIGVLIDALGGANEGLFENLLIEGCVTGMNLGGSTSTVRNVCCGGNGTDFSTHSAATAHYPMSTGATAGNGNWGSCSTGITGVTLANEYELDSTSGLYAQVKEAAPNAKSSLVSPTISPNLMSGEAWINEIGPKIAAGRGGVLSPYFYQKYLAGM